MVTARAKGGVWRHVVDLSTGLSQRGHGVTVTTPPGELEDAAVGAGLVWRDVDTALKIDADIYHLHLHETFDWAALHVFMKSAVARKRLIVTEHLPRSPASDPGLPYDPTLPPGRRKPGAPVVKRVVKYTHGCVARRTIVPGRSAAQFFALRWPHGRQRVRVVPNGVARDHYAPHDRGLPGLASDTLRLMTVGALGWRKGIDVLLDAMPLVTAPVELTIVGDGPVREHLEEQCSRLGLGNVEFLGWVDDAAHRMERADVICLPSRAEAFPYVILEAMRAARAVVASLVDGADEAVKDGATGLLVPPGDPTSLARAIDALAFDRVRRIEMGRAGRDRFLKLYTLDRMVEEILRVYNES
jgi:glycosyltransferase involved in cell wall biosynthesis